MFAEIYPILRLPRGFEYFDYSIPQSMVVHAGDIVKISFRNRPVLGVIRATKTSSDIKNIAPIEEVVASAFFTLGDILRYENIAKSIIQSPSSIIFSAMYGYKKREFRWSQENSVKAPLSVSNLVGEEIKNALKMLNTNSNLFVQTSIEGLLSLATILNKKFEHQILVLVARPGDVMQIEKLLDFGLKSAYLHGKVSGAQRDSIIQGWQNGNIKVLVGTKQASLIPAKKLDAILIAEVDSEDHSSWDRNPRYDARLSAELLAKQHKCKLILSAPLPRLNDYINSDRKILWSGNADCDIVSHKAEEQKTQIPLISDDLYKAIFNTLQNGKSVLLSYNRKGFARRLQCSSCGHIPFCGTCGAVPIVRENDLACPVCEAIMWIPKKCPSCSAVRLYEKGIGNQRLKTKLSKAFPNAKLEIIEKSSKQFYSTDRLVEPSIILATEYYFRQIHGIFKRPNFGLVAELAFDLHLSDSRYDASEYAAQRLHRLMRIAEQQKAECIVQTWLPDIVKKMLRSERFLHDELDIRKTYKLPPILNRLTIKPAPTEGLTQNLVDVDMQTVDDSAVIRYPESQVLNLYNVLKNLPVKSIIIPELTRYDAQINSKTS
ncbi:MAG: helicase-related protein [Candidatus Uhrbacteria bacterium]|nr:helicase-related protein [Candidatus Uhrbacteria bacterium]